MSSSSDPILLTPAEAADVLRVDRVTVEDLIQRGRIAALKVGTEWRIPTAAVSEFLSQGLQEQQLISLRRVLENPTEWARHLLEQPELANEIEAKEFPRGSLGEMLQRGLAALRAEATSRNVIPLRRREEQ